MRLGKHRARRMNSSGVACGFFVNDFFYIRIFFFFNDVSFFFFVSVIPLHSFISS